MLPFQILVWKAVLIARGSSFQFKPSQALLLSLCCSSTGSGKDKIKYSLAWLPISFPLGPRDAAIAEEKPALWHCQCLAPSSFARPVNAAAWYILCSFRKRQFCWRSGFVKQTLFFSLFWGFFFFTPSSPHTYPGPHPRTTLVPFSPTKGTKNFFYRPTGYSGYKEVKLTMW